MYVTSTKERKSDVLASENIIQGQRMKIAVDAINESIQPNQYSTEELEKLREFVETVKNDEARSALACWGNHDDYSHGY